MSLGIALYVLVRQLYQTVFTEIVCRSRCVSHRQITESCALENRFLPPVDDSMVKHNTYARPCFGRGFRDTAVMSGLTRQADCGWQADCRDFASKHVLSSVPKGLPAVLHQVKASIHTQTDIG